MYLLVCSVSSDAHLSAVVAMGGIEPPSALMLIAISPWLRVEGTAVGLTHPTLSS